MDINVYCYRCNSPLEVVEEYTEGYPFHGVTVKINPCPDCAAQQSVQGDKMIIEIESDWRETGIKCPECGDMTFSDGINRPRCAGCLACLSDEYIWQWLLTIR
jgi:tRNA(Ile2) C34 agmatinyltransferase TiaS